MSILLVRPPYTQASMAPASTDEVSMAITRHSFELPSPNREPFADWKSLVDYLHRQVMESRSQSGISIDESSAESLLEFAPPDILRMFLDRVETELIPNRKWQHAETLLMRMLKEPSVRQQAALLNDTVDLLGRVRSR